jgi:hypothetical protein
MVATEGQEIMEKIIKSNLYLGAEAN